MDKFVVKRARSDANDNSTVKVPTSTTAPLTHSNILIEQPQPTPSTSGLISMSVEIDSSSPVPRKAASTVSTSKNTRGFKHEWIKIYPWLMYDKQNEKAYCNICREAKGQHLLYDSKLVKAAFIDDGFNNWKRAIERFKGHEKSDCHRCAVLKTSYRSAGVNVVIGLSKAKREEMALARSALRGIVTSIIFLARQGLAIRGKTEDSSNFRQILSLRATDNSDLHSWLARSQYKWISHDIQNELLQQLSETVLRNITESIKSAPYYSIMIDETTDCSRHEQLVICFRYCDTKLQIHEVFTGFYELERQDAATLFTIIRDILCRFNIDINNCRGQCYDGAANVAGSLNGVQAKIRDVESRALFVHCAAHTINLVVQDSVAAVSTYRDALNTFGTLITFVRDSPKRLRLFESLQHTDANALRPFCPTRWVLQESALTSIKLNYLELWRFLDEISASDRSEAGAKAASFSTQLSKFQTFFNLSTLLKIFTAIGTVNQALQASNLHLRQARNLITNLKILLQSFRNSFDDIWINVTQEAQELGIDGPVIPRTRRAPRRLEDGADGHTSASAEQYYRFTFTELIDAALGGIENRFVSETWTFLSEVELALITKPVKTELISTFYRSDLDAERLNLHVSMFHDLIQQQGRQVKTFSDIVDILKTDVTMRVMLPE